MEKMVLLKNEYEQYLKEQMVFHKEEEKRLKECGSLDESVFEKIKYNVVDIFSKMFLVSYNKAIKSNDMEELYGCYKGYYTNIPKAWRERLNKARELNIVEDVTIEEIKLNKLEDLFKVFEECLNRYKN